MANGFVNLQAELRTPENNCLGTLGTLRGRVQRDGILRRTLGIPRQVESFDQFVALQSVLAAETIRVGALLNFGAGKTGGDDSRAGMHFDLMNHRADAGNEKLVNPLEGHRTFGEGDAFYAQHFFVCREQHGNLALYGNAERIFQEWILPGVHVRIYGSELNVSAFGKG